ncbi:MAG: cytochrome P450 [Acidimicrobiales bacterium]
MDNEPTSTAATPAGLLDPATLDDPFAYYRHMHTDCPVDHIADIGLYVVAPYDELQRLLRDPKTFSSAAAAALATTDAERAAARKRVLEERGWVTPSVLQAADPPAHTRHRKLVSRAFTPRQVQNLVPRIEQIVDELLDRVIARGEMEFVTEFAEPLPSILICELYGLPSSEYPTFRRWAEATIAGSQRRLTVEETIEVAETIAESQHHLVREFERRREHPTDDLISTLVHAHEDPDDPDEPFTVPELLGLMALLVAGGLETTTSALGTAMWLLLRYPDQMAKLKADPSLTANFVEESLRFDSPVAGLWRRTTCPVEVAGTHLPADAAVMPRFAAANRDPAVFTEPDVFDIERPNANQHVAFGLGPHYCIGASLARAQLNAAFNAILTRLDDIRLAEPLDEQPHQPSFFLRPLKRLPIVFRTAGGAV